MSSTKTKRAPAKRTPKKETRGRKPLVAVALARAHASEVLPLPGETREALESALDDTGRDFYHHLCANAYNASRAIRVLDGQRHVPATPAQRRRAQSYRHRADIDLLVRDDFARMEMKVSEARARLASIAHHADLRLFLDESGNLDPHAIADFGDAVQEYTEEALYGADEGKGVVVRRKIKLYDRTSVLEKVIKYAPVAEGGMDGADNIFTQINNQFNVAIQK